MRQETSFPIRNFWEPSGTVKWLKPETYLPKAGEEVLVTTKRGSVQACVFLSEWPFQKKKYKDVFIAPIARYALTRKEKLLPFGCSFFNAKKEPAFLPAPFKKYLAGVAAPASLLARRRVVATDFTTSNTL